MDFTYAGIIHFPGRGGQYKERVLGIGCWVLGVGGEGQVAAARLK